MRIRSSRLSRLLPAIVLAAVGSLMVPVTGALAADPPGNNGTVKIDGVPFDTYPNNEPHVGCVFQVDFYGFDEGDLNATVRFTVKPPTGSAILLDADRVFIGEDPAGGGTDIDAQRTYDLSALLQPYMAHPQQGYHIKLKVRAPGSIGADTKYKTFWVESCDVGYPGYGS
jgi:hypothetical protein